MNTNEQNYTEGSPSVSEKEWFTERNLFQAYLMEKMGVKHGDPSTIKNWPSGMSALVGGIIDSKDNVMIRKLIEDGDYETASELVFEAMRPDKKEELSH